MRSVRYSAEVLRAASFSRESGPIAGDAGDVGKPDDYLTKLVKYVPAETVAFVSFVSASALSKLLAWVVFGAALIGSVLYAFLRRTPQPWYALVLTFVAALVWVIGTTNLGQILFDLSYAASRVMLAIGVFLIPGLDEFATNSYRRRIGR